jgi:hypothetical protein
MADSTIRPVFFARPLSATEQRSHANAPGEQRRLQTAAHGYRPWLPLWCIGFIRRGAIRE